MQVALQLRHICAGATVGRAGQGIASPYRHVGVVREPCGEALVLLEVVDGLLRLARLGLADLGLAPFGAFGAIAIYDVVVVHAGASEQR